MPLQRNLTDRQVKGDPVAFLNDALLPVVKEMRRRLQSWFQLPTTNLVTLGAVAIDWTGPRLQRLTLDANVTAVTFTNPPDAGDYLLLVTQTGGGFTMAGWPSTVLWFGGAAPVITATNTREDLIRFTFDGSGYYATVDQNAF
jgi:hypothetical protein